MRVVSAQGEEWYVRRRWATRLAGRETLWQRFRRRMRSVRRRSGDAADVDPGCVVDVGEGIVAAVVVLAAVVFFLLVLLPLLVAAAELLVLALLGVLALVARIVFHRPWTVDALGSSGQHHAWRIVGWRASGATRDHVAAALRSSGGVPSDAEVQAAALGG